jgi:hypothetical protein
VLKSKFGEVKIMKNGKENGTQKKAKPKYSIHDYKPKKRYSREEKEKMQIGIEFMEIIRESIKKNEQAEESSV